MNKRIWIWMLPIVLMLVSFTYRVQKISDLPDNVGNSAFNDGEKLVYKVYYTLGFIWIPAGEVDFSVTEQDDSYEMKAFGKTYPTYASIFKVNDYFYTKIDKKTMLPSNFVRIVEEGNYRLYDSIRFQQDKKMASSYHGKTKHTTSVQQHQWNGSMQDLISNLYKLRSTDISGFKNGDKLNLQILFDKEVYPISITVESREKKQIKDLGKFNTVRINPEVVSGNVFKKGDKMQIWVSDDDNRIPLQLESSVSVGSVRMVLKSYKGLKYPLSSKV